MLTAKQPKGCDAKLQGLHRRQAEWQPVATLRRIAPRGWINFYEKERDVCALCNSSILFSDIDPRNLPGSNPKNKKKVKYKTMKKKPLLFALLALAIVTSLTAGTLAVYSKSLSIASDVTVKRFAFSTTGETNFTDSIVLAPTESLIKAFSVSNYSDKEHPAEVPLKYTIAVNIDAAAAMKGLTAELREKGKKPGTGTLLQRGEVNTSFTYEGADLLKASEATERYYEVVLTWVDDGEEKEDQAEYAKTADNYKSGLNITVHATQDI